MKIEHARIYKPFKKYASRLAIVFSNNEAYILSKSNIGHSESWDTVNKINLGLAIKSSWKIVRKHGIKT